MFEKEIKILDVNVVETEQILRDIGAEFIFKDKQKIYTYDLPAISHRFQEIIDFLKKHTEPLIILAYKQKLKTLLVEAEDLLYEEAVAPIKNFYQVQELSHIVDLINDLNVFLDLPIINSIMGLGVNPNKWVRLRQSNGKVTLTVKHVFEKNDSNIQKVGEYEIIVNDVDETHSLLTSMGFAKRNVQEKIRTQYRYKNAEIDIDEWPMLKPYVEIESEDESLYPEIINKCGFNDKEIVSCNTEELYRKININSREIPELLF